jgi:hypothetical protein
VERRELIDTVQLVDTAEATSLADKWRSEALKVVEPTREHLHQSAAVYLAMEKILLKKDAQAMAVNCLEITQTPKFSNQIINEHAQS